MDKLHKQAAKASKSGQTQFVVYVPDEGMRVFDSAQMKIWSAFVHLEAAYLNGQPIAQFAHLV